MNTAGSFKLYTNGIDIMVAMSLACAREVSTFEVTCSVVEANGYGWVAIPDKYVITRDDVFMPAREWARVLAVLVCSGSGDGHEHMCGVWLSASSAR